LETCKYNGTLFLNINRDPAPGPGHQDVQRAHWDVGPAKGVSGEEHCRVGEESQGIDPEQAAMIDDLLSLEIIHHIIFNKNVFTNYSLIFYYSFCIYDGFFGLHFNQFC
jgi:hypothetical protein